MTSREGCAFAKKIMKQLSAWLGVFVQSGCGIRRGLVVCHKGVVVRVQYDCASTFALRSLMALVGQQTQAR